MNAEGLIRAYQDLGAKERSAFDERYQRVCRERLARIERTGQTLRRAFNREHILDSLRALERHLMGQRREFQLACGTKGGHYRSMTEEIQDVRNLISLLELDHE
jgi:hypothetical protein